MRDVRVREINPVLAFGLCAVLLSGGVQATDVDGDGVSSTSDCDDADNQVWSAPGEARDLVVDRTSLSWSPPASLGGAPATLRYDALRSSSRFLVGSSACVEQNGSDTQAGELTEPSPGEVLSYLVVATNPCGDGPTGLRTGGVPRANVSCSCPLTCDDGLSCTADRCESLACVHETVAPKLAQEPKSRAACPGGSVEFSVAVGGANLPGFPPAQGTVHYQWKKNGVDIGVDSPVLTLTGLAIADDRARIECVVTDGCGQTTSEAATLTVFASTASCSGGGNGFEAPNGGSEMPTGDDPARLPKTKEVGGVHLFSGEYHLSVTDLAIRGLGFDFVWMRTYRSREGRPTAAGFNWDFSYNRYITLDGDGQGRFVHDGNGRRDDYRPISANCWAAPGVFRELCIDGGGAYTLTFPDRTRWGFAPLGGAPAAGKIQAIVDRNGNTMTFAYDAAGLPVTITDTLGRTIAVSYRSDGRISTLTDFTGRQVRYDYYGASDIGGGFGDLRSVTGPAVTGTPTGNDFPLGKTWTYEYTKGMPDPALDHNLITLIDPLGQVYLRNTYTSAGAPTDPRFDRLERQSFADGSVEYVYVRQTPGPGNSQAVTKTIVNDRAGNVREVFYNGSNQPVLLREFTGRAPDPARPTDDLSNRPMGALHASDPPYFETRCTFSNDLQLQRVTLPAGNFIEHTYDSTNPSRRLRANRLQTVRDSCGLGGDQSRIVETWTYGPTFGREPCACRGCCGEGGGRNFWLTYQDGRGNTYTRTFEPDTGDLQLFEAPAVTTGVLGGGSQSITWAWLYDSYGRIVEGGLSSGRSDYLSYFTAGPENGYLESVTKDLLGFMRTTSFGRDAVGNLTSITAPSGATELLIRNQLDEVVRRVSPSPFLYEWDFDYDGAGRLVAEHVQNVDDQGVIQPNSHWTRSYEYDELDRKTKAKEEGKGDREIVTTEYAYDANDNLKLLNKGESVRDRQPTNVVRYRHDERDLLFQVTRAEGDPGAATLQIDYDANGNPAVWSDGIEATPNVTTAIHDGFDRTVRVTDPEGNVTVLHYDAGDNVVSARIDGELVDGESGPNVRLAEASWTFDEVGRRVQEDLAFFDTRTGLPIDDGVSRTRAYYNPLSQLVRAENDRGHSTDIAYDTMDRFSTVTDQLGNSAHAVYDPNSNVQLLEENDLDSGTFNTSYNYDALDRVLRVRDNLSNSHWLFYDSRGNVTRRKDARDNTKRSVYDGLGRLVRTEHDLTSDGTGAGTVVATIVTTRTWDDSSRLVGRTDDGGNITTYVYDALDRPVGTIYADGTSEQQTYDVHDNVVGSTDANGSVATATHDRLGRLIGQTIVPGPGVLGTLLEVWKYDGLSRVVHAEDDDSIVTRAYDSLSNVVEDTLKIDSGPVRTLTAAFDGAGNRTSLTYPSGRVVTTTYDDLERESTISIDATPVATYTYVGTDRVSTRAAGNGITLTLSYDLARQIREVRHGQGGPLIFFIENYSWDAMYNKTSENNLNRTREYWYDSANRLSQSRTTPVQILSDFFYSYDGVGNRTSVTGICHDSSRPGCLDLGAYAMTDATPEPADRQTNQYTSTPFDTRAYDQNGNLIQKGTQTIRYDYRDQMVELDNGVDVLTFDYDALGRRIASNGTELFQDGWQGIEERDQAGNLEAISVFGRYVDEILYQERDIDADSMPDPLYIHADDHHNVVAVTGANGAVLERYQYGEFGEPRFLSPANAPLAGSAIGNRLLYNGRPYDTVTGLYDFRTRSLDPRAGRFTTRDTIGIWGDGYNLGNGYTFLGNAPAGGLDPMGMGPKDPLKGINISLSHRFKKQGSKDDPFGRGPGDPLKGVNVSLSRRFKMGKQGDPFGKGPKDPLGGIHVSLSRRFKMGKQGDPFGRGPKDPLKDVNVSSPGIIDDAARNEQGFNIFFRKSQEGMKGECGIIDDAARNEQGFNIFFRKSQEGMKGECGIIDDAARNEQGFNIFFRKSQEGMKGECGIIDDAARNEQGFN